MSFTCYLIKYLLGLQTSENSGIKTYNVKDINKRYIMSEL